MNLVERDELRRRRMTGCFLGSLLLAALVPARRLRKQPHPPAFKARRTPSTRMAHGWA